MRTSTDRSPTLTPDAQEPKHATAYSRPTLESVRDSKEVKNELLAQMQEDVFNSRGSSMNNRKKKRRGDQKEASADYSLDFDEDTMSDNRSALKSKATKRSQGQESRVVPKFNMLDLNKLMDTQVRRCPDDAQGRTSGSQDSHRYIGDVQYLDPRELDQILQGYRRNQVFDETLQKHLEHPQYKKLISNDFRKVLKERSVEMEMTLSLTDRGLQSQQPSIEFSKMSREQYLKSHLTGPNIYQEQIRQANQLNKVVSARLGLHGDQSGKALGPFKSRSLLRTSGNEHSKIRFNKRVKQHTSRERNGLLQTSESIEQSQHIKRMESEIAQLTQLIKKSSRKHIKAREMEWRKEKNAKPNERDTFNQFQRAFHAKDSLVQGTSQSDQQYTQGNEPSVEGADTNYQASIENYATSTQLDSQQISKVESKAKINCQNAMDRFSESYGKKNKLKQMYVYGLKNGKGNTRNINAHKQLSHLMSPINVESAIDVANNDAVQAADDKLHIPNIDKRKIFSPPTQRLNLNEDFDMYQTAKQYQVPKRVHKLTNTFSSFHTNNGAIPQSQKDDLQAIREMNNELQWDPLTMSQISQIRSSKRIQNMKRRRERASMYHPQLHKFVQQQNDGRDVMSPEDSAEAKKMSHDQLGRPLCPSIFNHKHFSISTRRQATQKSNNYGLLSIQQLPTSKLPLDAPLPLGQLPASSVLSTDQHLSYIQLDPLLQGTSQGMLQRLYVPKLRQRNVNVQDQKSRLFKQQISQQVSSEVDITPISSAGQTKQGMRDMAESDSYSTNDERTKVASQTQTNPVSSMNMGHPDAPDGGSSPRRTNNQSSFVPKISTSHRGAGTGLMIRKIIKSQNKYMRRDHPVQLTATSLPQSKIKMQGGYRTVYPRQQTSDHFPQVADSKINVDIQQVVTPSLEENGVVAGCLSPKESELRQHTVEDQVKMQQDINDNNRVKSNSANLTSFRGRRGVKKISQVDTMTSGEANMPTGTTMQLAMATTHFNHQNQLQLDTITKPNEPASIATWEHVKLPRNMKASTLRKKGAKQFGTMTVFVNKAGATVAKQLVGDGGLVTQNTAGNSFDANEHSQLIAVQQQQE